MQEHIDYCEFEYYGSKHLENDLTKFIQQNWFYKKFNVDKRSSYISMHAHIRPNEKRRSSDSI